MLRSGDRAPGFELADIDGGKWPEHWSEENPGPKESPVVLVFFKVSCPTCQYTMPYLERLRQGERPDAPELIAISQDDPESTHKFRSRFGLTIRTLIDPAPVYTASNLFRITQVPSFFVIEANGVISAAWDGFEKGPIEDLAARFGIKLFSATDWAPASRPG